MTRKQPAARSAKFAPFVGFINFDHSSQRWVPYAQADPKRPISAIIVPDDILKSRRPMDLTAEEFETGTINPRPHHPDRPVGAIHDPSNLRLGLGRGLVKRYGSALGNMGDAYNEIAHRFPAQAPGLFCDLQHQLVLACEEARNWEATDAGARFRDMDDSVKRGRLRMSEAAKAARTLAKIFSGHPNMIRIFSDLAMTRTNVFLTTMRVVAKGQPAEQIERVPALARWLVALGEAMSQPSARKHSWFFGNFYANLSFRKSKITVARPGTATCLMFELAYLFRQYTGPTATQDRWAGEPMPTKGKPHWSHVAALTNAAELRRDGRREILSGRQCQEAVKRLLKDNHRGVGLRPWRDGRGG